MSNTLQKFDEWTARCRALLLNKHQDYGSSWRILRPSSLTDQLYIKAKRLRSIEEKGTQKIDDSREDEYVGLINYSLLAILQLQLSEDDPLELSAERVATLYDAEVATTRDLLAAKNHDYGEAWRDMRISSITDLMLAKLLRIKQIEDNRGATLVSEGIAANYRDIINYAVFSLIKLEEANTGT